MRVAGDPRLRGEGDIKEVKREEGREGKRGNREFHFEARDLASGEGLLRPFPQLPSFLSTLPHMMSPITPSRRPRRRPAKFLSLFTKGGGGSTALAAGC